MVGALTHEPGPEDFRALARSSPWRFTRVHLTHRQTGYAAAHRPGTVEAWLDRASGRVTVRSSPGSERGADAADRDVEVRELEVSEGVPYGSSGLRTTPRDEDVVLRPDGLVAARPQGWHYEHGDPMWRDYQWTAMLDPVELADGTWTDAEHEAGLSEDPSIPTPAGVEITDVEEVGHGPAGRRTWRAVCSPVLHRYDPRCGCCPLLDSVASRLVEYGPEDPTLASPRETLAASYLVSLDVETGIVVDVTPLDGDAGSSFVTEILAVDEPLTPPDSAGCTTP